MTDGIKSTLNREVKNCVRDRSLDRGMILNWILQVRNTCWLYTYQDGNMWSDFVITVMNVIS
jgi:hypothetical protein